MSDKTYTTIQGDMWDSVSLKVYGNEKYIDKLIKANFKYREEAVFPAGIVLNIPEITEDLNPKEDYQIPKWRADMK
ncbi:MAG: phage tail protein [Clostridiales bacterium]|jgi:phage tail protein X|nr:phage tail protein [Clostridiales bacterium]